ncbi:MAG TPA: hypothetical protein PLZ51_09680 [Aggregatilineales bacterium]|nr:hypothetical protein [Aggregatilineales bacterium]
MMLFGSVLAVGMICPTSRPVQTAGMLTGWMFGTMTTNSVAPPVIRFWILKKKIILPLTGVLRAEHIGHLGNSANYPINN